MVDTPYSASLSQTEPQKKPAETWRKAIAVGLFILLLVMAAEAVLYRLPDNQQAAKCIAWMQENPNISLPVCDNLKVVPLLTQKGLYVNVTE